MSILDSGQSNVQQNIVCRMLRLTSNLQHNANSMFMHQHMMKQSFLNPLQVGTNGYFSFGIRRTITRPSLFSSTSSYNYLVAPFGADIDIRQYGYISYEVHNTSAGSSSIALLNRVSTFISNQQNTRFSGNWMLVATWNRVPAFSGSSSAVSSQHGYVIILCQTAFHQVNSMDLHRVWNLVSNSVNSARQS